MMTKNEMNEYLESIEGLNMAYKVDQKPITNSDFFYVNSGWLLIIKELIDDLIKLGWDKRVIQVKEKFGGLRFYINGGSDEMYDRIMAAERLSYEICEICGEKGEVRRDIGWYLTLCEKHYNEKHKSNIS